MLLHVGRRTYPDGDKHLEILRDAGLNEQDITRLKSLPPSFDRGMVVAVMELGRTYETTIPERSTPEMQQSICAYGADSGKIVTEIRRVSYLKRPVPMAAQGGVFKVQIDPDVLPYGEVPRQTRNKDGHGHGHKHGHTGSQQPSFYTSISTSCSSNVS
jgi:hypothetical protein